MRLNPHYECADKIDRSASNMPFHQEIYLLIPTRTDLKEAAGISFNVLAKMGKGEFISLESIYKICLALDCDIGDVVCLEKGGAQK